MIVKVKFEKEELGTSICFERRKFANLMGRGKFEEPKFHEESA